MILRVNVVHWCCSNHAATGYTVNMHTRIEIDDILLAQAKRITGLKTTSEVVNEALRRLVCGARSKAIRQNNDVELLEDLDDIEVALERLKNPGPTLSMEEAKKELGLED